MLTSWKDTRALKAVRTANQLVIAAHPDDETFWAGMTLATGEWAAVCLTHRSTRWRRSAFQQAMAALGCIGVQFDLPDRGWDDLDPSTMRRMRTLVARILGQPQITHVLTHSPDGETGHPFHKLISSLVTQLCPAHVELLYFTFDPDFDAPRDSQELWGRKERAIKAYFDAVPGELGNDVLHARLSRHEARVAASGYHRQAALLRQIYAGSSVPNADIPDATTSS